MGGNVFTQDFKVLPLQLDSLSSFTENIKHILDEFKLVYKFPKYFKNKVTFNDLDIICDFTNAISKSEMIDWAVDMHPDANWPLYKRDKSWYISEAKAEHMADALAAIYAGAETKQFLNLINQYKDSL